MADNHKIGHASPMMAIASRLVRFRTMLVIVGVVLFVIAVPLSWRLPLDRSITSMFAPGDPTLVEYQMLQQTFGGNAVAMVVYQDTDLMSEQGLARSEAISQSVQQVDGVKGVLSPSVLNAAVEKMRPADFLIRSSDTPPLARRNDVVARGVDLIFSGYTHSRDHTTAAVVAMLDPDHSPQTIAELKRIAHSLSERFEGKTGPGSLVGEPVLIHDGFNLVERDGRRMAMITLVSLSVVVLVSLLDIRFVLLTALIVVWSVVLTKATAFVLGMQQSLVSTIMTAIVTVIAVAAVLHLGIAFQSARTRGHSTIAACERALARLSIPIFWTCMTDAAGFAALAWSRILPVRQFGLMIAVASIAVFIGLVLFAPALMSSRELHFLSPLGSLQRSATFALRRYCVLTAIWFVNHRIKSVIAATLLLAISVIGTWQAIPETSFLRNFRESSPIVVAYGKVERDLGGAGIWDVILPAPREWSSDYFAEVRKLQNKLRKIDVDGVKLTKVLSVADADYVVALAPLLKLTPPRVRLSAMRMTMPHFFDALITEEDATTPRLRIMLRSEESLPAESKTKLIAEVQRTVDAHLAEETWQNVSPGSSAGIVTGYYVMMSRLISQLVGDQWRCLAAAGISVWLLLWIATGSLRLSIAALLPNLLPAFVVLAISSTLGEKMNMGATMIAAVSVGITIDGSVHLLAGYARYRSRGQSVERAVCVAAGNVGVPLLFATAALIVGFSVLSTSEFIPTATFGVLLAATLLLGTIVNLTLLPACIAVAVGEPSIANAKITFERLED